MTNEDTIRVPPEFTADVPARIAFLGEAPSVEELDKGKPFVGPAGRIFNAMLRTAGLRREDYWIGNVFDQKLPDNDIGTVCRTKKEADEQGWAPFPHIPGIGVLHPDWRHHLDRLGAELAAVRPNIIVPLGGTALWALTNQTDISTFRGNVSTASWIAAGTKILPTFHPAHVMRLWKFFPIVVGDFIKAERESAFPELRQPKKTLWIAPTLQEVKEFCARCLNADRLSVDIETGWGQITCLGLAPTVEEGMCIPFVDLSAPNKSYWKTRDEELAAWACIREVLESPGPKKLGQNFPMYDAFWLLQRYGIKVMNFRDDTRLLHHALYPELPKDLAFMAGSYTNQGPWKHMGRKHEKRDD